jgi:hypothetical protein
VFFTGDPSEPWLTVAGEQVPEVGVAPMDLTTLPTVLAGVGFNAGIFLVATATTLEPRRAAALVGDCSSVFVYGRTRPVVEAGRGETGLVSVVSVGTLWSSVSLVTHTPRLPSLSASPAVAVTTGASPLLTEEETLTVLTSIAGQALAPPLCPQSRPGTDPVPGTGEVAAWIRDQASPTEHAREPSQALAGEAI